MRVSVVATVLNEEINLPRLLDGLAAQTRPVDEVVICDGGSTDGTLAVLRAERRLPLTVVKLPGSNISQGRNAAIKVATGEAIAVTDAGVQPDPGWLKSIVCPLEEEGAWGGSGFFRPDPKSVFEVAMSATVLPREQDIQVPRFLPSSRSVAFRKSAWAAVGGYPEWLDYCEDLIFDLRLFDRYGPFPFVPQAVVYFRPRGNLRAFFLQYYRYARGDGKADLWRLRHAVRYATYLLAVPLIAAGGVVVSPWLCMLLLMSVPGMFWNPWRRLVRLWGALHGRERIAAFFWVPAIRVTGDLAKMAGYPIGLLWRLRHRKDIPDWRNGQTVS